MKEVYDYLEKKIQKNSTIVVGVSGGSDSMCLLYLLLQLKKQLNLKIIVAHINHNIRKESEIEAKFVEKYTIKNKCFFEYLKINSYEKENFESNARKKRYQFYNKLIKKYQAKFLMTAHHGDDLVETILMRLIRGSNLKGYAGFKKETKYENYTLLRPLINVTKKEIELFNQENNIKYYNDKTNQDIKFTRARYRHNILPLLKAENKNIHQKFLKFSNELYEIERYLEKETDKNLTKVIEFDKVNLHKFKNLDLLLQKRIIEYFLKKEYQDDINIVSEKHLTKIFQICYNSKSNLSLSLPKRKTLLKCYNYLYFKKDNDLMNKKLILEDLIALEDNKKIIKIKSTNIVKSNFVLRLNSQEISLPLYVRNRKKGDYIEIKNLNGKKKIKDIFIDEKIPLDKRDTYPIIVDNNDTILWLPGLKKSKFDKNNNEFYDIIYKYVISEEN